MKIKPRYANLTLADHIECLIRLRDGVTYSVRDRTACAVVIEALADAKAECTRLAVENTALLERLG